MRLTFLRRYRWLVVGMGMFLLLVLVSACAGVPITTTTTNTASGATTPTAISSTTPGANQQTAIAIPGSIQLTGPVMSVNASTIVVQMPDRPLTMSTPPQMDRSHNKHGLPAVGQLVKVDTNFANGAFIATKLESTDAKDAQDQNIVQYQGQALSPVGADNILHFGVGNATWDFQITSSTVLDKFDNNAQKIQAGQKLKVKVQFSGSNGTALKIETDN
ncbi:hypothetical protein KSF_027690 [Reticulibacter mediterranei]|uniref:DUF5666 domain-containing protein n=1 Tax=Reticulibacter mediterranei TaxID=2778369 RepID=A0A8J3INS8_9CHLR|nr:DUF5666 domain-containing protein [Reticulibacter mediterranei]GHO92721.1 hypothetical protein KSF_027690 [Reticulibacter mediterranei]